jgi:hypothetical protein
MIRRAPASQKSTPLLEFLLRMDMSSEQHLHSILPVMSFIKPYPTQPNPASFSLVSVFIMEILFQRYLVQGISTTGLKG